MNPHSTFVPREVFHLLATYWRRWLAAAGLVAVLAAVYALWVPPVWQASQALILRNEAASNETAPGRFSRAEDLKAVEETILELAKNQGVLASALKEVGPPANCVYKAQWPRPQDADLLQQNTKVSPPKGVEFGTSEIFYVEVRDSDRVRAVQLNHAICDQLQARFQAIRDAKAQSMIDELTKTVQLAGNDLNEASVRLTAVEKNVGSDLAELRGLLESSLGDSALRRSITEIENELRQTRVAEDASRQLLGLLKAAKDDSGRLMAAPSRLLELQPALKRLKEGLVDAQLRTARLQGRMSAEHPLVIAAKQGEEEIGHHLHAELAIAVRGLETELQLDRDRIAMLEGQLGQVRGRLSRLAGVRTTYANLVGENNHRAKLVERAQQNLAEARAARAAVKSASLISCIDAPETGTHPVGPGRAMVLVAGILGGLLTGFCVVLLTVPPRPTAGDPPAVEHWPSQDVAPQERSPAWSESYSSPAAVARRGLSLKQALKVLSDRPEVPHAKS